MQTDVLGSASSEAASRSSSSVGGKPFLPRRCESCEEEKVSFFVLGCLGALSQPVLFFISGVAAWVLRTEIDLAVNRQEKAQSTVWKVGKMVEAKWATTQGPLLMGVGLSIMWGIKWARSLVWVSSALAGGYVGYRLATTYVKHNAQHVEALRGGGDIEDRI